MASYQISVAKPPSYWSRRNHIGRDGARHLKKCLDQFQSSPLT